MITEKLCIRPAFDILNNKYDAEYADITDTVTNVEAIIINE